MAVLYGMPGIVLDPDDLGQGIVRQAGLDRDEQENQDDPYR
jgi:hypothetical protein